MAQKPIIQWGKTGEKMYETGIDHAVLYPLSNTGKYDKGYAWNGITVISEKPSGADSNPFYADNGKYLEIRAVETFGISIEAYMAPREFGLCDGTAEVKEGIIIGQQNRQTFGISYRTVVGNDVKKNDYGSKIHLVYGCSAAPSDRSYTTINESPDIINFSWDVSTTPVPVEGFKPTSCLIIDTTKFDKAKIEKLELALYGGEAGSGGTPAKVEPHLPLPDEVLEILK